jgi:hypothetical protein
MRADSTAGLLEWLPGAGKAGLIALSAAFRPVLKMAQSDRRTRCLAENLGDFLAAELEDPT